jgi:hypothetical protein
MGEGEAPDSAIKNSDGRAVWHRQRIAYKERDFGFVFKPTQPFLQNAHLCIRIPKIDV